MATPAKRRATYEDLLAVPEHLIAEITGSSSRSRGRLLDRSSKRRIYAREGIRWLWLVEPETKTLETFALDGHDWKLLDTWHDDAVVRAVPFDAIELELAAPWRA